jgi:hypothetical protein
MRILVFIGFILLIASCSDAPASGNEQETTVQKEGATTLIPASSADKFFEDWDKLVLQVESIQQNVVEERANWQSSYEEMQYPETVVSQLTEENRKKVEAIIAGASEKGKDFDLLVTEVQNWESSWVDQQRIAEQMEKRAADGTLEAASADFKNLQEMVLDTRQKLQDWRTRLNKYKSESVLFYNTVNGIIVSSGAN